MAFTQANHPASAPAPAGGTGVLERTETRPTKAPGDGERYAHFVSRSRLERSRNSGQPVVALCGKVWVPLRNPAGYPICPACKAIRHQGGSQGPMWPFSPGAGSGE